MAARTGVRRFVAVVVSWLAGASLLAAAQQGPATTAYLNYRAAVARAATIDDVRPLLAKEGLARLEGTPQAQRPMMLGLLKDLSAGVTNVRVVKETIVGDRATLKVEATDASSKAPARATVEMAREAGAWKFVRERWGGGY